MDWVRWSQELKQREERGNMGDITDKVDQHVGKGALNNVKHLVKNNAKQSQHTSLHVFLFFDLVFSSCSVKSHLTLKCGYFKT